MMILMSIFGTTNYIICALFCKQELYRDEKFTTDSQLWIILGRLHVSK